MQEELNSQDLQDMVPPVLDLCREAGEAICTLYHAPGADQYEAKGDDSPLTRADLQSHALLRRGLASLEPALPLLSEESSPTELAERRSWRRFWLVDPLDGTKEFLTRTGEFTINIALIIRHRPVLGVLYLPLKREAYVGIPGVWARHYRWHAGDRWAHSGLATRSLAPGTPLTVLASRRHRGPRLQACLEWLGERWQPIERHNSGSALKFCQLAEGRGDFYPRFSPCSEWDTAAGQALLEAAGGSLLGLDGEPLRYNCRDTLLSRNFIAVGDAGHHLWRQLLDELPR
jgi:3'(2'), 5'-bisphosphate nucleotidase